MARLIDVEKAIKLANETDNQCGPIWNTENVVTFLESMPLVDAVKVVRCKDCKRGDYSRCGVDGILYCMKHSRFMVDDDFCSYGARRDDNAAD